MREQEVIIIDFSKDYNPFIRFFSIFFGVFGLITIYICLIFYLKMGGFSDAQLIWLPTSSSSFPYNNTWVDHLGISVLTILCLFFIYMTLRYSILGLLTIVYYDPEERMLVCCWNGLSKKKQKTPIEAIKKLSKYKSAKSPKSVYANGNIIPVMSFQTHFAYMTLNNSKKQTLLFQYHQKSIFDQKFDELQTLIQEKKKSKTMK